MWIHTLLTFEMQWKLIYMISGFMYLQSIPGGHRNKHVPKMIWAHLVTWVCSVVCVYSEVSSLILYELNMKYYMIYLAIRYRADILEGLFNTIVFEYLFLTKQLCVNVLIPQLQLTLNVGSFQRKENLLICIDPN